MKNRHTFTNKWVFILAIVVIIIPIIPYYCTFSIKSNQTSNWPNFSNQTSDWSNFATFFAAFISLANLFVFIYFSELIYKYNLKRDELIEEKEKQIEALEKPILAFNQTQESIYEVTNIGRGAALNVKVFVNQKVENDNGEYQCWGYRCYSMYVHQTLLLKNTSNCIEIGAKYTDIFGNEFNSYMKDYSLKIFDLRLGLPSISLLADPEPTLHPL
ncbi:hypothetical protein [Emticicia aquatilis]|nr:hypothetical protein [Emticicia aquatilis]